MFIDPHHKAAFAVSLSRPVLPPIKDLIGLPADDHSGVLVATIDDVGLPVSAIEEAGIERGSDIVFGLFVAESVPAAPPLFALGVRNCKYLWNPGFQLWLPGSGELAVFVPATLQSSPCFHVEAGRLFDRMPFTSMADRERGVLAAHRILCSSVEG